MACASGSFFRVEVQLAIIKPLERDDNLAKPKRKHSPNSRFRFQTKPAQLEEAFGISSSRIFQILGDYAENN